MKKGISIITDFGCPNNCWYCIWKNNTNNLKDKPKFDYDKLFDFLNENKHLGKVSISGGGDPLHNYFGNLNFWIWLIKTCEELNIKIDIHTREKLTKQRFWSKHVNLCAFSCDKLSEDKEYLEYLSQLTKVRIVHVVTNRTTNEMIEEFILFCDENNCQLTLKQLTGFSDNNRYNEIKQQHPNLFYLDYGDYNLYYMPNNIITDKFI